jgi:hypothetical protein
MPTIEVRASANGRNRAHVRRKARKGDYVRFNAGYGTPDIEGQVVEVYLPDPDLMDPKFDMAAYVLATVKPAGGGVNQLVPSPAFEWDTSRDELEVIHPSKALRAAIRKARTVPRDQRWSEDD